MRGDFRHFAFSDFLVAVRAALLTSALVAPVAICYELNTLARGAEPPRDTPHGQIEASRLPNLPPAAIARLGAPPNLAQVSDIEAVAVQPLGISRKANIVFTLERQRRVLAAWDLVSEKPKWQSASHRFQLQAFAFSESGNLVCVTEAGSVPPARATVFLHAVETGREIAKLVIEDRFLFCAALSSDGKYLATGGPESGVSVWNVASGERLFSAALKVFENALSFSEDGKYLAVLESNGDLSILDWRVRETVFNHQSARGQLADSAFLCRIGASNRFAWVEQRQQRPGDQAAGRQSYTRAIFVDMEQKKIATEVQIPKLAQWFRSAISPDGRLLVVSWYVPKGKVTVYDLETGEFLLTLSGHSQLVSGMALSHDSSLLVTGGGESTILVWDTYLLRLEGLWSHLASRKEEEIKTSSDKLVAQAQDSLRFVKGHIEMAVQLSDRERPTVERLASAKYAEREEATRKLKESLGATELALRIFYETDLPLESRKRLDAILPSLEPREKELWAPQPNERMRLQALKHRYGDDYIFYPDTPGAAEFRSIKQAFGVLERINTPAAREFLETLATRRKDCWFAIRAKESLERMKK